MAGNLPPGVSINDSDAPWNQDYPEPEVNCEECEWYGNRDDLDHGCSCPFCGSEQIQEV